MTFILRKKETLIDILVRLPAKSLVRFLCTCKSWSDLIASPSFVSTQLNRNVTKNAHVYLLCLHRPTADPSDEPEWCLFSNETFEQCSKLSHPLGSPDPYRIYGSSNGLVCISDTVLNFESPIHIWNPSVRRFRTLPISTNNIEFGYVALQFGFHPGDNDYKVVRMMCLDKDAFRVEVYSLSRDSWKMIEVIPPWLKCNWQHYNKGTFFKGVAYHFIEKVGPIFSIVSFDSVSEEFEEFIAPDAICSPLTLCIDVYKEQICLLLYFYGSEEEGMDKTDAWVLEEKRWRQLRPFIYPSNSCDYTMGISTDNELLIGKDDYDRGADLCFCNYQSTQVRETGIKLAIIKNDQDDDLLFAITYMESLVWFN